MRRLLSPTILLLSLLGGDFGCQASYGPSLVKSVPQYRLLIRVFPQAHRLEVTGTVRIPPINTSRVQLQLSLHEQMHDLSIEVLEPSVSTGMARLQRRDSNSNNIEWAVYPRHPIPAGASVLLRFSYAGGEQLASQFYIGPEVSFASAWGTSWYPLLIGRDDQGIGILKFSVPAGQTVIAGGRRRSTSAEEAQGTFSFEITRPTYLSFAAGRYSVLRRDGVVPVSAYLLRPRQHMDAYLAGAQRILQVLVSEFGAYPFEGFALVEIPRELAHQASFNAASVQGFILTNSRAFDAPKIDYLLGWFGHEFSHQWFPHTVSLHIPPGRYMEEALAEYGGLRVVETLMGSAAAERYRRTGFAYDPIYSALAYFKLIGAG